MALRLVRQESPREPVVNRCTDLTVVSLAVRYGLSTAMNKSVFCFRPISRDCCGLKLGHSRVGELGMVLESQFSRLGAVLTRC